MEKTDEHGEERQIVVFSIGEEEFGVNIGEVREIIRSGAYTRIPNTAEYVRGVINLRGSIIVVIDLAMKLSLQGRDSENTRIIVIENNGNTVGMLVDSATEVMRLTSDRIHPPPPIITDRINAGYIEGVGIVGDRLLILLDLAKVLEGKELASLGRQTTAPAPSPSMSVAAPVARPQAQSAPQASSEKQAASAPSTPSSSVPPAPAQSSKAASKPADHPAMKDVYHEWHFITHDGKPLKNVTELLSYVHALDEGTFRAFVNEEKNDFANWIGGAVGDKELADRVRNVSSKDAVTKEIRDRILEIHLGGSV